MKYKFYILTLLLLTITFITTAEARLDVVPQKVIIQPRERGGEFTILNLFNQSGSFRIELLNYLQDENGVYSTLLSPLNPDFDPSKVVRFTPRQFSLEAGGRQKVRMSLRKPADLPEGEYRFHIKATRFADNRGIEEAPPSNAGVSVQLNVGVAIPVIVRHGNVASDAQIENAELVSPEKTTQNRPELHLDILREGNASAIGKINVFWQPENAKQRQIGLVSNANIFTEINRRSFKVPLSEMPIGKGQILIRYSDEIEKGKVIDEKSLQL